MNKLIIGLLSLLVVLQVASMLSKQKDSVLGVATPAEQITSWVGGAFSGDLSVGGTLALTGTSTFSGDVIGSPVSKTAAMTSSATTTACFITPSISYRRFITAVGVVDRGTAASIGSVNWTVGTSTATGVAPTGVKLVSNVLTRASGVDVISTTSTVQDAYSTVAPGESIIFQSSTTTNAGYCYVVLN